ncbi:MAG: response regulator transcription factor [Solirubrobacterales bacterium]|nr:response regulator transcription factor [Solirubrobacterales bacterium]
MKVLIVDDHPIARRGLQELLVESLELADVTGVEDGAAALNVLADVRPDLILLDLHLPTHPRGAALCAQLRAASPASRIVLVTAFEQIGDIKQCLVAGADGCLLKDTSDGVFADSLRRIEAGETVLSPRLAERLAADHVGVLRGDGRVVRLSPRERQVLDILAEGCSNREIAERLVLAPTTVKDHIGSLLSKLGATSRLQAVLRASDAGLL